MQALNHDTRLHPAAEGHLGDLLDAVRHQLIAGRAREGAGVPAARVRRLVTELYLCLAEEGAGGAAGGSVSAAPAALRLPARPPQVPAPWWVAWGFRLLVAGHGLLVVAFALSFFLLPFGAPWYVALPLMTFMFYFTTTSVECQLTNLENYLRGRLGKRRIRGFVGHYFLRPARALLMRRDATHARRDER